MPEEQYTNYTFTNINKADIDAVFANEGANVRIGLDNEKTNEGWLASVIDGCFSSPATNISDDTRSVVLSGSNGFKYKMTSDANNKITTEFLPAADAEWVKGLPNAAVRTDFIKSLGFEATKISEEFTRSVAAFEAKETKNQKFLTELQNLSIYDVKDGSKIDIADLVKELQNNLDPKNLQPLLDRIFRDKIQLHYEVGNSDSAKELQDYYIKNFTSAANSTAAGFTQITDEKAEEKVKQGITLLQDFMQAQKENLERLQGLNTDQLLAEAVSFREAVSQRDAARENSLSSSIAKQMSDKASYEFGLESVRLALLIDPDNKEKIIRPDIADAYAKFIQDQSFSNLQPLLENVFAADSPALSNAIKDSDARAFSSRSRALLDNYGKKEISEQDALESAINLFSELNGKRMAYSDKSRSLLESARFFGSQDSFKQFFLQPDSRNLSQIINLAEDNNATKKKEMGGLLIQAYTTEKTPSNEKEKEYSLEEIGDSATKLKKSLLEFCQENAVEIRVSDSFEQMLEASSAMFTKQFAQAPENKDVESKLAQISAFKAQAAELTYAFEVIAPQVAREGEAIAAKIAKQQRLEEKDSGKPNAAQTRKLPNVSDGQYASIDDDEEYNKSAKTPPSAARPSSAPASIFAAQTLDGVKAELPPRPSTAPASIDTAAAPKRGLLGGLRNAFSRIVSAFSPKREAKLSPAERLEFLLDEMAKEPLVEGTFRLSIGTTTLERIVPGPEDKKQSPTKSQLEKILSSEPNKMLAIAAAIKKSLRDYPIADEDFQVVIFNALKENFNALKEKKTGENLDAAVASALQEMPADQKRVLFRVLDAGIRVYKAGKNAERESFGEPTKLNQDSVAMLFGPNIFALAEKKENDLVSANEMSISAAKSLLRVREKELSKEQSEGLITEPAALNTQATRKITVAPALIIRDDSDSNISSPASTRKAGMTKYDSDSNLSPSLNSSFSSLDSIQSTNSVPSSSPELGEMKRAQSLSDLTAKKDGIEGR